MLAFLANTWPMFAALALVLLITIGATMPYIRAEKKRRARLEQTDD